MNKSKNYERNAKVLEALDNAGANLNKEHNIEHHLYCYSKENYEMLIKLGERNGYRVVHAGKEEDEEGVFWQLDLIKPIKPNLSNIECQSKEIELFAEKTSSDYDGWGTELEK